MDSLFIPCINGNPDLDFAHFTDPPDGRVYRCVVAYRDREFAEQHRPRDESRDVGVYFDTNDEFNRDGSPFTFASDVEEWCLIEGPRQELATRYVPHSDLLAEQERSTTAEAERVRLVLLEAVHKNHIHKLEELLGRIAKATAERDRTFAERYNSAYSFELQEQLRPAYEAAVENLNSLLQEALTRQRKQESSG